MEEAPSETLRRVWGHVFPHTLERELDHMFVADESMIGHVVVAFRGDDEYFLGVTVTRAQANAALEYWRAKKIEVVEQAAARL